MQAAYIINYLSDFMWPFARVTGLLLIAPLIGSSYIPLYIKILVATAITAFVYPLVEAPANIDPLTLDGVALLAQQIMIGLTIGLIMQVAFSAITIAGENIALTMGLGFASMTDPANGVTIPVVSQIMTIFASLYFLALNGHIALIELLINSFITLPVNGIFSLDTAMAVAEWGGRMFIGALLVSIPAVTALLVVNISMGLMTRVAPQMNVFSVGFPLTMMLGFIFIAISIPMIMRIFQDILEQSVEYVTVLFS
ncbi:MAG: flagellar biosynthetic protein FliR [Gammaproteobacteria bacterium]|nr:flagellar biosynthetic protein FliR [Gammaproteobacteria bacterium]